MKKVQASALLATLVFSLSACNEESNSKTDGNITSMAELAGVYEQASESDSGATEYKYLSIDSNGKMTNYTYKGDITNTADGCYTSINNADSFTHISGDQFKSSFLGTFTASKSGNIVTVKYSIGLSVPMVKTQLTVANLEEKLCSNNSSTSSTNASINSVGDFVGIYENFVTQEDNTVDEKYVKVGEDGSYTEYDYLGDSYDLGNNCYSVFSTKITHISNNRFSIVFDNKPVEFSITLSDGEYIVSSSGNPDMTFKKSSMLETSFTSMLCAE
jgi:hypothetical protein